MQFPHSKTDSEIDFDDGGNQDMKELEKLMGDDNHHQHPLVEESAKMKAYKAKIAAQEAEMKLEQEQMIAQQKAAEEQALAEAKAKKKSEEEEKQR